MRWHYAKLAAFLKDIETYIQTKYGADKVLIYHHLSREGILESGMGADQAGFLSPDEFGYYHGMFSTNSFYATTPIDQYWNAGITGYLNSLAGPGGMAALVDPMYLEIGWDWFTYTKLAPSFEHGGQEYSERSEILALAAANPKVMGKSDYCSIHRGFPDQWNEFTKHFYLVPNENGSVLQSSVDITVKTFSSGRVLVMNKSLAVQTVNLSAIYSALYNKATGATVNPASISVAACSMVMLGTQPGGNPYETECIPVAATSGDALRTVSAGDFSNGAGTILDADAPNDYVGYTLANVAAGSYRIKVGVKKYSNRGIVQLYGARADNYAGTAGAIGVPIDLYSTNEDYTEIDFGAWSPASASDKQFRFVVTGKNSASGGYSVAIDYIRLDPN